MIVINKKRISVILSCVLIAVFAFYFQIANHKNELKTDNNFEKSQKTVTTTATPVSGKTIVLDAGHGVPDERCTKHVTEQQKQKRT